MKRIATQAGSAWLIGIVALALTTGLASAQDGPKAGASDQAGTAIAPASRVKFTNRLSSTVVFIENQGQFDPRVKFQAQIGGQTAWLTAEGIVFDATRSAGDDAVKDRTSGISGPGMPAKLQDALLPFAAGRPAPASYRLDRLVFAEDLVQATCCSKVEGKDLQPGNYNYFPSRDASQWRTNVRGFGEVVYRDVWPGIDLRVYGNGPNLEQEFIVRPGGELSLVQVAYRGIDKLSIAVDGSLEVATAFGTLRETKPRIFQQVADKQETVEGRYKLTSRTSYSFDARSPNPLYALVIDPTLLYSTFLGGSAGNSVYNQNNEVATGIAVDASGNAYVAGNTASTDFPITTGAFQTSPASGSFITKLDPTGSALVYSTYLGFGTSISAIAVDSAGHSYVTGLTTSTNFGHVFPTTANAYWPTNSTQQCANTDFFVTEFNSAGNQLIYSSCFNSNYNTLGYYPRAIAADSNGRAYIAGGAGPGLATTSNAYQPAYPGGSSAAVTVFDTTASGASSLVYSTYLGPSNPHNNALAYGIAVDAFGKIYVTGDAHNGGFPVTQGAFQMSHSTAPDDAFIAKLDPSLSGSQSLIYIVVPGIQTRQ